MKWTPNKPPTEGVSFYHHTICDTPIGKCIIEWKAWKERPDYSTTLNGVYIGTKYTLSEAKGGALLYLKGKLESLTEYLNKPRDIKSCIGCDFYSKGLPICDDCCRYEFYTKSNQ